MLYVNKIAVQWQSIVTQAINVSSEVERKISSFASLPNGWDYGRGGPISQPILDSAFEWNRFFRERGFLQTNAFPGGDGEVTITAGYGDHDIEIILEPDGLVSVAYDYCGKPELYRPNLAPMEATWVVTSLMGQICSVSGYSTPISSTNVGASLLSRHSAIQKRTGAYQLSAWNVFSSPDYPNVNTFVNFGEEQEPEYPESSGFLPFFGSLNQPYSLSTR